MKNALLYLNAFLELKFEYRVKCIQKMVNELEIESQFKCKHIYIYNLLSSV